MISLAAFYGWIRTAAVWTTDAVGSTLYASFAAATAPYGIRIFATLKVTPATTANAEFTSFFRHVGE